MLGWVDGFGSRTWMRRRFAFAKNNELTSFNPHESAPFFVFLKRHLGW